MTRRTLVSLAMVIGFATVCLAGLGFIALNMGLHGPWSSDFALDAEFAPVRVQVQLGEKETFRFANALERDIFVFLQHQQRLGIVDGQFHAVIEREDALRREVGRE